MTGFNELEYTRDREIKALIDIQDHGADGSALEGCTCLQGKHFYKLESNSEEGMTIATREKEKEFYAKMVPFARQARKAIVDQTWEFPSDVAGNPRTRAFLPHGLTEAEKASPELLKKLKSCIKQTELKCCGKFTKDYSGCSCNPVAVCRSSVV